MSAGAILIRADASTAIGTGHVMRCLALTQAVQDSGGRVVFAMAESTPSIRAMLAAESCEVASVPSPVGTTEDASQTVSLAIEGRSDWVVVDGYRFGADYQRTLKAAGLKILFLDDYGHASHYFADLALNQNVHANENLYAARESYTRLLLGTRYCLLRREFSSWRDWKREVAVAGRKVLVAMGGSDPENVSGIVIEALRQLPDIEAIVVVGNSNPHFETLQRAAVQVDTRIELRRGVTNMPELMAWADIAVSGSGTTTWEMCLLQLPMALISIADNQKPIAHALKAAGAAIHLGSAASVTEEDIARQVMGLLASATERARLSERCGKLVDGLGTGRVLAELRRG